MDHTTDGHDATVVIDGEEPIDVSSETPPGDAVEVTRQRAPLSLAETRWLLGIVAVAASARLGWLIYANVEPPTSATVSGDSYSYWYYANELAAGRGYLSYQTGEPTAYYPIGYPAILATLFWLALHTPITDDLMVVAGLYHVVISTAIVALTFVVGRRLFGPLVGLMAAGILAVWPNLVFQVTTLQIETTFIFLTVAALAIAIDHNWSTGAPSRRRMLGFGAVLALSAVVRPFSLPLLVGLLLALLAVSIGWRRSLRALALPVVVIVASFTPWTIRNLVEMDAFVPSSTNMGDTLCLDRNMDARGGLRWSNHDGCVDPALPEVERNTGNTRKAIEFVIDHPDRELLQIVRRARYMFAEDHDGVAVTEMMGSGPILSDATRDVLTNVADWYFFLALGVAIAGLPLMFVRPPRAERRLALTTMIALLAIPLLLWGNPRFHHPLAPFIAIAAAAGLAFAATYAVAVIRARSAGVTTTHA